MQHREATGSDGQGGWPVVAAYAAVAACTQLLWLTYAPITTDAAVHYGVSESAIGWLANAFPLLYVVLAIPAGRLLDLRLRPALAAGGLLTGLGGLVRLGGDAFAWALAGQTLVAVAQPLVLGAVTRAVALSLPARHRTAGIGVASAGIFLGLLLALVMGAAFGGSGGLQALLVVQGLLGAAAAVWLVVALRAWPAQAPVAHDTTLGAVRASWDDLVLRRLAVLSLCGFGVFVALTTWLQALEEPAGMSATTAGVVLAVAVLAGVVAAAWLPGVVAARAAEPSALRAALLAAAAGCLVLAATGTAVVVAVATAVAVAGLLVALPVLLDLCERRAGSAAATATNLIWLAGNLGGLVVALLVGALVDHPAPAFVLMALVALGGVPLVAGAFARAPAPARSPTVQKAA